MVVYDTRGHEGEGGGRREEKTKKGEKVLLTDHKIHQVYFDLVTRAVTVSGTALVAFYRRLP